MQNESVRPLAYFDVEYRDIETILSAYFEESGKVNIIIIGANNGKTKDFLLEYLPGDNVSAVLVEPLPDLFVQLKENLSGYSNLYFENSAIYARACKKSIYRVGKNDHYPAWAVGLGSFKKTNVLNHSNQLKGIRKHLVKEVVSCITFDMLVERYRMEKVNVVQIDTEGYDFE